MPVPEKIDDKEFALVQQWTLLCKQYESMGAFFVIALVEYTKGEDATASLQDMLSQYKQMGKQFMIVSEQLFAEGPNEL